MSEWCHRCGAKYRACEKCTKELIDKRDAEIVALRRAISNAGMIIMRHQDGEMYIKLPPMGPHTWGDAHER